MSLLKPHKSFLSHMHIVYMRTIISFKNRQICNELLTKNSVQSHKNKFQRISRATCITCKLTLVTSIFFTCFGLTFICPASLLSEYLFKRILIDIFFLQILTSVKEIMVVLRRRSVWTPSAPTAASVCLGTGETGSIVKASDYQSKTPVTFLILLPSVTRDNIKHSFILYYLRCWWMFQGRAKLLWQACLLHEYGRLLLLHLSKGLLWKRFLLSW